MAAEVKAMEIKKSQQLAKPVSASATEAPSKAGDWKDVLGNIKAEFGKISWTTPEELSAYTKIVVAGTFLFGMGIYVMDLVIQLVLNSLSFVMRLIGG